MNATVGRGLAVSPCVGRTRSFCFPESGNPRHGRSELPDWVFQPAVSLCQHGTNARRVGNRSDYFFRRGFAASSTVGACGAEGESFTTDSLNGPRRIRQMGPDHRNQTRSRCRANRLPFGTERRHRADRRRQHRSIRRRDRPRRNDHQCCLVRGKPAVQRGNFRTLLLGLVRHPRRGSRPSGSGGRGPACRRFGWRSPPCRMRTRRPS